MYEKDRSEGSSGRAHLRPARDIKKPAASSIPVETRKTTAEHKKKKHTARNIGRFVLCFFTVLLLVVAFAFTVFGVVFLGPSVTARDKMTKSLLETSAMKWVPSVYLSTQTINKIVETYDFKYEEETSDPASVVTDNTISLSVDVDSGITMSIARTNGELTVKGLRLHGGSLEGADFSEDEITALLAKRDLGLVLNDIFTRFVERGYLEVIDESDEERESLEILVCAQAKDNGVADTVLSAVAKSAIDMSLSASVRAVYVAELDPDVVVSSSHNDVTYGKAYFSYMIAQNSITLYGDKLVKQPVADIVSEAKEDGVDIKALVASLNEVQSKKSEDKKQEEENEWADYPDGIKIVRISGPTYVAHMMIVRDPSKVYVGTSGSSFSATVSGKRLNDCIVTEKALAGINGGYFIDYYPFTDPRTGIRYNGDKMVSGQIPVGIVYSKGKLVWDGSTADGAGIYSAFGFVGFDTDNTLVISTKKLSSEEAQAKNIRDGVCGGPMLIINGVTSDYKGATGEAGSLNPRTAIGQRSDGAVLFLCVDGRMANSLGATYSDVIDIMVEYGAVNAACLDGGSSTIMYYHDNFGKFGTEGDYVRVNTYSSLQANPRKMPTFFMVSE